MSNLKVDNIAPSAASVVSITNPSFTGSVDGILPSVKDNQDRATKWPTPTDGQRVYNIAAQQIQQYSSALGGWFVAIDRPSEWVNPKRFALSSWTGTIATGIDYYLTPAEVTELQSLGYHGLYFAYVDTRDYVCLQEAIYEAAAPTSVNGNIVWSASGGLPKRIHIPPGTSQWMINRPLWGSQLLGFYLGGHSPRTTRISNFMPSSRVLWTDAMSGCTVENLTFNHTSLRSEGSKTNFWHPPLDTDWFGQGGPTGGAARTADLTFYTVQDSGSPNIKRAGSGWTPNQFRGQYLVIIDDAGNNNAIGQVIRIRENTSDTLYLDGRWTLHPSLAGVSPFHGIPSGNGTKFVIAPFLYGWGKFHDDTGGGTPLATMVDWNTDFNANNPDGKTLYRFYNLALFDNTPGLQTLTIGSHTQHKVTATTNWGTKPRPNPSSSMFQGVGPNGQAEMSQPFVDLCNFVIGGTFYDNNGGLNAITADNDTWVTLQSALPGALNDYVGRYLQTVSSAQGYSGTVSAVSGNQITANGVSRTGDDIGRYLIATSGAASGGAQPRRLITGVSVAGGNTTWTLDSALGVAIGDSIQVVDAGALGQILPVAQQPSSTKLQMNYEASGITQRYLWSRRPRTGDQVNFLARPVGVAFTNNLFQHVEPTDDQGGDLLWAWARSGDQSMGSEAQFIQCAVNGTRCGFYASGLNVINLTWRGGQGGARDHIWFIEKGWMNIHGPGIGGPNVFQLPCQRGANIYLGTSTERRSLIEECDGETGCLVNTGQNTKVLACAVASGLTGFSLSHVWNQGDYWSPANDFGRQFMCVDVIGTGDTTGAAEPALPCDGVTNQIVVTNGGNGARFMRLDFEMVTGSGPVTIDGGTWGGGIVHVSGAVKLDGTPVFSRLDWNQGTGDKTIQNGVGVNGLAMVNFGLFSNHYSTLPVAFHNFLSANQLTPTKFQDKIMWSIGGALVFMAGDNGNQYQGGFKLYAPSQTDGSTVLLALLPQGSQDTPIGSVVLGAIIPPSPNDSNGNDTVIAGGMARGAGVGGKVTLKAGSKGGTTGATIQGLVDAAQFDNSTTAGETRMLLYDVSKGAVSRVTVGAADSGGTGFKLLRVPN